MSQSELLAIQSLLAVHDHPENVSHGYCILMDIVESTAMKTRHGDWKQRFVFFYQAYCSLIDRISPRLEPCVQPVIKFLGDSAFAYLPMACGDNRSFAQADPSATQLILAEVRRFLAWIQRIEAVLGIRLRTVLSYVTHIELVEIARSVGGSHDALGQGIDFTFRLEKFASPTSICLNSMFKQSLTAGPDLERGCYFEPRSQHIKGWAEAQNFWIMRPAIPAVSKKLSKTCGATQARLQSIV